jgi:hypothetical protein
MSDGVFAVQIYKIPAAVVDGRTSYHRIERYCQRQGLGADSVMACCGGSNPGPY